MSNQLIDNNLELLRNIIYNDGGGDHLLYTMTVLAGTMMDALNKLNMMNIKIKWY